MASRPFWKGYLKLSLVSCAVAITPATSDSEKVRFHTLNRRTGNRVRSQLVDAATNAPVEEDDEVKGYARGEGDYVILEDDDLDAVKLETTHTIDIEVFVPADRIGWIWYDKPHYVAPDDAVGEEAFGVIRDAMASTKTVGISRLVLYRRERAVMVAPRGPGMILWTLRLGDEVRDPDPYFPSLGNPPDDSTVDLARKLIGERMKPWSPDMVRDPVQERLLDIIGSKRRTAVRRPAREEAERPVRGNVVNIMDALRRSLASGKSPRSRS